MMYNELVKTFQIGRAYPVDGPELESKQDKFKKTYKFKVSHFVVMSPERVRVYGQCEDKAWCTLDYKPRTLPKWLRRKMEKAQP